MSEELRERGTLKIVRPRLEESMNDLAERLCGYLNIKDKAYKDDYIDCLQAESYEYIIINRNIYKVMSFESGDYSYAIEDNNGTITFDVSYYNGVAGVGEVIERVLKNE